MKVQQETNNNVEYIGEIRENKVGIDRANIDFIATLLTSNLYSKPFESFLREAISNAYDSHVEAGTDHPIILVIDGGNTQGYSYYSEKYNVSIRDYGVGISPERFQKIYTNIGSSTKRESNDYIGGWGIGRFAALACSDNVQINSYYNGTKYSYIMYKNGTGINIDKISEQKGDFKQGVEIHINNVSLDTDEIKESISKLIFFENLVIRGNNIQSSRLRTYIDKFNERQIDKFNNFCSSEYNYIKDGIYAKIGRVLYPIDRSVIRHDIFENLYNFIAIECPIGSVNVTPNREQLQYTDKTVRKLTELLDKTKDEITDIINNAIQKDFKSINEVVKLYDRSKQFDIAPRIKFDITKYIVWTNLKINGSNIIENVKKVINELRYEDLANGLYVDNILNKGNRLYKSSITYYNLFTYKVAIKYDDRLKQVTKAYYCANHTEPTIVIKYSDVKEILKRAVSKLCRFTTLNKVQILRAISFILKHYEFHKLINSEVPEEFIKNFKTEPTKKTRNEDIKVRYFINGGYSIYYFKNFLRWNIEKCSRTSDNIDFVVYGANRKDDLFNNLSRAFCDYRIAFITLKKEDLPNIPNSKRFISVENFLTLYHKLIAKMATADLLRKKYMQYYQSMGGNGFQWDTKFKDEFFTYLQKYRKSFSCTEINELIEQYQSKNWLDWSAIVKFSLSENDKKRLSQRFILQNLEDIQDSLLYIIKGRNSKDKDFGIKPNKKTTLLLTKLLKK